MGSVSPVKRQDTFKKYFIIDRNRSEKIGSYDYPATKQ